MTDYSSLNLKVPPYAFFAGGAPHVSARGLYTSAAIHPESLPYSAALPRVSQSSPLQFRIMNPGPGSARFIRQSGSRGPALPFLSGTASLYHMFEWRSTPEGHSVWSRVRVGLSREALTLENRPFPRTIPESVCTQVYEDALRDRKPYPDVRSILDEVKMFRNVLRELRFIG